GGPGHRLGERSDTSTNDATADQHTGDGQHERDRRHERALSPQRHRHPPHLSRPRSSGVRFSGESSGIVVNMTSVAPVASFSHTAACVPRRSVGTRRSLMPTPPRPTFAPKAKANPGVGHNLFGALTRLATKIVFVPTAGSAPPV